MFTTTLRHSDFIVGKCDDSRFILTLIVIFKSLQTSIFCFTSKAIVVDASWYGRCDLDVLNFFSETRLLNHSTLSD